jgi:hypothetical protein
MDRKTGKFSPTNTGIFSPTATKEFWNWDTSPYVKGKLARGMQIGHSHVATCAGYIERHVLPSFKGRTLASITTADVEAWLLMMKEKGDLKAKSINFVYMSFRTGMCEGEIRGLLIKDVHDDYIDVQHSWEQGYGLKVATWGSERRVTVPKSVTTLLVKLIEQSPYKNEDDLVFYGGKPHYPTPYKGLHQCPVRRLGYYRDQRGRAEGSGDNLLSM